MIRLSLILPILLAACLKDETISGYAPKNVEWRLIELNGAPFSARATLSFPEQGRVAGRAPCNRYFGSQTVPYPWFEVEQIGATKMACAALDQEQVFFDALTSMTLIEVAGNTLILSNDTGQLMVFQAVE